MKLSMNDIGNPLFGPIKALCNGLREVVVNGSELFDIFFASSYEQAVAHISKRENRSTHFLIKDSTLIVIDGSKYDVRFNKLTTTKNIDVHVHVVYNYNNLFEISQSIVEDLFNCGQPGVRMHTSSVNSPLIERVDVKIDSLRLLREVKPFINADQVCINSSDGNNLREGAGSVYTISDEIKVSTTLNTQFRGGYVEEVYNTIKSIHDFGRARIMTIQPKTNYSFHADITRRLHIPLTTNDKSFLIVGGKRVYVPADGYPYIVNTKIPHTAMNGHNTNPRTHIVFALLD